LSSAFLISLFYGQPQLKVVIPILALVTLVQGFQNIGLVIVRSNARQREFKAEKPVPRLI